ncbi:MAG: hypothetical protein CL843_16300 [Crocinitomicaceae bacterium]|nr:hypothetical protein [Crocinitomicaceae bacterium]|tara:strand:- start:242 stop:664 length:423 start_codon:yes stop_codon:yes gene_type:complete
MLHILVITKEPIVSKNEMEYQVAKESVVRHIEVKYDITYDNALKRVESASQSSFLSFVLEYFMDELTTLYPKKPFKLEINYSCIGTKCKHADFIQEDGICAKNGCTKYISENQYLGLPEEHFVSSLKASLQSKGLEVEDE